MSRPPQYRVVVGLLALVATSSGFAHDMDKQLEQIAADWKKRQERVQRVRYRVSGEVLSSRDSVKDERERPIRLDGARTINAPFRWTYLLDFRTNRHRLEIEEHLFSVPQNKLVRTASVTTFDGKFAWGGRHPDDDSERKPPRADISIMSGEVRARQIEPSMFPPFYAQGVVPYAGTARLHVGHLTFAPDTEGLVVHGQAVHDGRPCLVLRTPARPGVQTTFDELWVDVARDSAIVRHARYAGKSPIADLYVWYRQTSHGWFPERWEQTIRGVKEIKRARVEELEIDPTVADADFQIAEKPGMLIRTGVMPTWDEARDEVPPLPTTYRHFRIDENGQRREVDFKDGVEVRAGGGRWKWLVLGIAALVVALGFFAVSYRRQKRRPRASE